jgi:hypothetical protein
MAIKSLSVPDPFNLPTLKMINGGNYVLGDLTAQSVVEDSRNDLEKWTTKFIRLVVQF